MSKRSITSSFKRLPGGFLLVLALFILTEAALHVMQPELISNYWGKTMINMKRVIDMPGDYDYIIVGNSVQFSGINPALIDDKMLNLSMPAVKPLAQYLILRRYLKSHRPPRVIFLFVNPERMYAGFFGILRYYMGWDDFLTVCKDLSWFERESFLFKFIASLAYKRYLFSKAADYGDDYKGTNREFVETMKKNRGFMPSPNDDKILPDDFFDTFRGPRKRQNKVALSRTSRRYIDKIISLAGAKGIKVVYCGALIPKGLYDIFEMNGFNSTYRALVEKLKKKYPEVYFTREPVSYYPHRYYGDFQHLNKEGVRLYTDYFKNEVFAPFSRIVDKGAS